MDVWRKLLAAAVVAIASCPAAAGQITIEPDRDNSIFAESNNSAGQATTIFSGRNNPMGGGNIRRALLHFDVAGSIPAGATIQSVSLQLRLDGSAQTDTLSRTMGLHRLAADWGEGTSGGGGPGTGMGQAPTTNDATWNFRFFNTQTWTTPGGDFNPTASGTTSVGITPGAFYTWSTTPGLVADVQAWLNTPLANFGWALVGVESTLGTVRRFQSGEAAIAAQRPLLTINFLEPIPLPEPATWLLVVTGMVGIIRLRRTQRAQ